MLLNTQKHNGFTLVEVLAAIAVAAILLSSISLNIGLRDSLYRLASEEKPSKDLQSHLEDLLNEYSIAQIESYIGTAAADSDLSDPATTTDRKLVEVTSESIGPVSESVSVIAVEVSSGDNSLTRWLTPTDIE